MKVYRIAPDKDMNACTEKDLKDVMEWLKNAEVGHVLRIEVGEMSEEDYGALPEYTGP
jgi:hypothetical protein